MTSTTESKPIKVGFVGLSAKGWAATSLAPSLTTPDMRKHIDIVAVSTTSEESAKKSAENQEKQLGHPVKAYHDLSKIVNDPDVDLVAVSVQAPKHKDSVLPVIEAGKNFFIEWPVGNRQTAIEIAQAAREKGLRSIVGLQARQAKFVAKVREILESGKLGKLLSTSIIALSGKELNIWTPNAYEHNGYYKKDVCVTPLSIGMGHLLDTLTTLLGDFASVQTTTATVHPIITLLDPAGNPNGKTHPAEIPDHYTIAGILKSGVVVNIFYRIGYVHTPGRRQFLWEIDGEEGSLRLENNGPYTSFISVYEPDLYLNGEKVDLGEGPSGFSYSIPSAWKAFAEGKGGYATIEDAVKIHELLAAIEKSQELDNRFSYLPQLCVSCWHLIRVAYQHQAHAIFYSLVTTAIVSKLRYILVSAQCFLCELLVSPLNYVWLGFRFHSKICCMSNPQVVSLIFADRNTDKRNRLYLRYIANC